MPIQALIPSTSCRSFLALGRKFARSVAVGVIALSTACTDAHVDPLSQTEPVSEAHRITSPNGRADETGAACEELPDAVAATYIVFDSDRDGEGRDLYLIRADGSGLRRLTRAKAAEREAAVSPDGTQLAYVSDQSGAAQIHIFDFATGKSRQLTKKKAGSDQPSWFSDSARLAFHSGASVFLIGADGGDEQLIGTGLGEFNAFKNPAVSLDGDEVLVDRNNEINALNIQTGDKRPVIRNWTTQILEPAVSLDGELIAYSVACTSRARQIAVAPFLAANLAPCEETLVTAAGNDFGAETPAWGPENHLAYVRVQMLGPTGFMGATETGWSRIVLTMRGEAACELEQGDARDQNPSWAPEGFSLPDDFSPF